MDDLILLGEESLASKFGHLLVLFVPLRRVNLLFEEVFLMELARAETLFFLLLVALIFIEGVLFSFSSLAVTLFA
jgi:hypothetical protein